MSNTITYEQHILEQLALLWDELNQNVETIELSWFRQKYKSLYSLAERIIPQEFIEDCIQNNNEVRKQAESLVCNSLYEIEDLVKQNVHTTVNFYIMSSMTANMLLKNESDVDIGVMIDLFNCNRDCILQKLTKHLELLGYVSRGWVHQKRFDGYFSFCKNTQNGDIELKFRDSLASSCVLMMHMFIDNNLGSRERSVMLAVKNIAHKYKETYKMFKALFYNNAMNFVSNGYIILNIHK